ncbi:MAG: ABC transporter substrate-binding protein, partial [Burkholderiales bacterium]|nr:ABC transporter substrate-binding protein [Burkholderiales bacterium]
MPKLHIKTQLIAAALFISASLIPFTSTCAADIRVGVVLDQNGVNADTGRDYIAGARTWFDHINASGGVNGRRIQVIVKDDEGVAANAVKLTRELIDGDKVEALFGYVGDESLSAVSTDVRFSASRTVLFAPLSGAEIGTAADSIIFLRPTYKEEVRHAIRHFGQLSVSKFAVVYMDNSFGRGINTEVRTQLNAEGNKPIAEIAIPLALTGLPALARKALDQKPQVIVITADTIATAEFVKQVRSLDINAQIVTLSTVNHRTLMELAKKDFATGTMITQLVPNPLSRVTKLQNEHLTLMAKYRDEPPSHLTLEGFLAAKAFVKLLERAGRDLNRASISAAVTGSPRFDLDGMSVSFGGKSGRGSQFVDIAFLRKSGTMLQ